MAETTPLIGGRRNIIHQHHRPDDGQPRRRTGPQHLHVNGRRVSPGKENEFDKADRRTLLGRLGGFVAGVFNINSRAGTSNGGLGRKDGVYYEDDFNDQSWSCTFGTTDNDGVWLNYSDQVGTMMSTMVWVLIAYSCLTITLLAQHNHLRNRVAMAYCTICALALASHAKTALTDPGSIPRDAVPVAALFKQGITTHAMCSHCQTYKPPYSHHCRICNRCISRMDHHCPWMNNCVGAGNFKHFILFLCYTWTGCAFALIIFAGNYFFCSTEDCTFSTVLIQLVRVMTVLCIVTLMFTSSMLMNVTYGIITGIGTIDRLKKKAEDTVYTSEEEPIPLEHVFGIGGYWTWPFPIDPVFPDYDKVMGYSIPQRLMREMERDKATGNFVNGPKQQRDSYDQV